MGRTSGAKTKKNLVLQAFILFSKKPYDAVTFSDLEKATGLTRGAILYHMKTKQDMFHQVVESSLQSRASILEVPVKEKDCLKNFILDFVNVCEETAKAMASLGIKNINLAHYNIENQALYYYENFDKLAKQIQETELKVWTQVVKKAIQNKEIKPYLNPEMPASVLYNTYLGHAYSSAKEEKGCNTERLRGELLFIYEIVKS